MQVYNELFKAAFENVASDPVSNLFDGRVIFNTTASTPKIYYSGAWQSFGGAPAPSTTLARRLTSDITVNDDVGQLLIGPIVENLRTVTVSGGATGGELGVIGPMVIETGGIVTVNSGGLMRIL